eukprot:4964203-Prymnesium_polylepis.1
MRRSRFERAISASCDHSARTGACAHWIAKRAVSKTRAWSRALRPDAVPFWQTRIGGERRRSPNLYRIAFS